MSATTRVRTATTGTVVYVVHTYEGNTFEAPLSPAEAEARLAKLLADPEVTGAHIERRAVKLTAAQRASLDLVAADKVSYSPGRESGVHSRYSFTAQIGAKFARRTKSVDVLVDLGVADLKGSASSPCRVMLTEAGEIFLGIKSA